MCMSYKNISLKILLIAIVAAGFASCNSYKELPQTPKADTENLVRDANDNKDTTSIADVPWKTVFTDDKLQALIEEGISNNYDLKVAVNRIKESEANLSMATNAFAPTLAIAAQANDYRISSGSNGTKVLGYNYSGSQNSLGFTASWEVDIWGKLNNQARSKYAAYLQSLEYRNYVQTSLVATVAKDYYTLLALDEQLRVTKETVVLLRESAATMQALMDAGQTTQAAVEQSNALLYSTQLSIYDLESQIHQQENAICVLTGRKPGVIARNSINDQRSLEFIKDNNIPVRALANRPDVRQAQFSMQSAYALTSAAKANFYPSLSISALSFGFGSATFSNFFAPANLVGNIVAGLTQPLFNKGQIKGNLKLAQAQQEEAVLTFSNTVLAAGQEVSDILFSYKSSMSKNEWRDKQIESLTKAVDYTEELLKAGEANYNDVITAQNDLLSAQLSKVSDKLSQITYNISFYKAMGGGIK